MLKFYYHPLSPLSRRVWIALLEKQIPFTPIEVNIQGGEQFKPEFLALNPFHHVPVIVDDGLRVIESLAILDYLESKYPTPALLPDTASQLAKVRMAQMVSNNEMSSLVIPLMTETEASPKLQQTKRKITRIFNFLAGLLGEDPYFGGDSLSLGDITAGNATVLIAQLDFDLRPIAKIHQWRDRLMEREVWQQTQPNESQMIIFKQAVQKIMAMKTNANPRD